MSNYTKTTDFDVKDSLPSGDTGKIIRGSEFEVEFENIEVAIASKADSLNTVLTGNTSVTNLSVTGNTTLGNAASDTVTVNADFSSDLLPSADATYDLGAPGSEWQDLYVTGTANVDSLVADTVAISGGTITATLTGNVTGNLTGTVLTAAQPNITSVGSLLNLDVTGTTTTDALTVATAQGNVSVPALSSTIDFARAGTSYLRATNADGNFRFVTGANDFATSRLAIANNGDISFYEDTGVTAKFFWDASAESLDVANAMYSQFFAGIADRNTYFAIDGTDQIRAVTGGTQRMVIDASGRVGIGTSNPVAELEVASGTPNIRLTDTSNSFYGDIVVDTAHLRFDIDGTERLRITDAGNVGIGTSVPSELLEVSSAAPTTPAYSLFSSGTVDRLKIGYAYTAGPTASDPFGMTACNADGDLLLAARGDVAASVEVYTAGTERMRIDANGNVGINTSPGGKLSVRGTAGLGVSDSHIAFGANQDAYITTGTSGIVVFREHDGVSTNTERMRIDASGNLGIGTSNPDSKLAIKGTSTTLGEGIKVYNASGTFSTNNAFIAFSGTDSDGTFRESTASWVGCDSTNMSFRYGGSSWETATEHMVIDSSGNVGIGTSSPLANLEISAASDTKVRIADSTNVNQRLDFDHNNGASFITAGNNTVNGVLVFRKWDGTSTTESMRIDADGNVGIGTSSPSAKLDVFDTNSASLKIRGTNTSAVLQIEAPLPSIELNDTSGGASDAVIAMNNSAFTVSTGATERLRIDSSGNLLVGQSTNATPATSNNVGAAIDASGGLSGSKTGVHILELNRTEDDVTSREYVRFYRVGSANLAGTITATKTTVAYNTSSDVRLKENITDAPEGNVDALQVRSFDWKADGTHQEYGFIAQELETVAPYAVTRGEAEDDMWGVDYSKLVPMLVKEIQDLKARIATLEAN